MIVFKKAIYPSALLAAFLLMAQTTLAQVTLRGQAPALKGALVDGSPFDLSQLKGKVVVINFWASWCAPCQEEMPLMEKLLQEQGLKGLEILAINMDKKSGLEAAKKIMSNYSFKFALQDQMDFSAYGRVWRLPSTFIIDRAGVVIKNGLTGEPQMDQQLISHLVLPALGRP